MKICNKCLLSKIESKFTIDKTKKDNLSIYCKHCQKIIRENNKDKYSFDKDYYKNVNDNRKDYLKSYYQKNKEKIKQYYQDSKSKKL
jgi:hypothetical protein